MTPDKLASLTDVAASLLWGVVLPIVVIALLNLLKKWMTKMRDDSENKAVWDRALELVDAFVQAAEQIFTDEQKQEKYDYVATHLSMAVPELPQEQVRPVVEAAVHRIKTPNKQIEKLLSTVKQQAEAAKEAVKDAE